MPVPCSTIARYDDARPQKLDAGGHQIQAYLLQTQYQTSSSTTWCCRRPICCCKLPKRQQAATTMRRNVCEKKTPARAPSANALAADRKNLKRILTWMQHQNSAQLPLIPEGSMPLQCCYDWTSPLPQWSQTTAGDSTPSVLQFMFGRAANKEWSQHCSSVLCRLPCSIRWNGPQRSVYM